MIQRRNSLHPPPSPASAITITGHLEKIAFRNPQNHYTVARIRVTPTESVITAVGHLPGAEAGETVKLTGAWVSHPRFGEQFQVTYFEILLPETIEGIGQYLSSGLIKGIGPKVVARIVDRFGKETLTVIENDPQRLVEVRGIGKKTADRIGEAWKRQHTVRTLMQYLQANELPTAYSGRLMALYGDEAVKLMEHRPYQVALDWPRVGFTIADAVAQRQGLAKDNPDRAKACLLHLVTMDVDDGHTLAEAENLTKRCEAIFDLPSITVTEALDQLCTDGELVTDPNILPLNRQAIYLPPLFRAETAIVQKLAALGRIPLPQTDFDRDRMAVEIVRRLAIALSKEQQRALEGLLSSRIAILTGGPGTGKTTLIRSLTAVHDALGRRVELAAPTGRAAKRLSHVSGQPAGTIHRLLRYNVHTDQFDKNRDDPLDADVVIIDEASMVDTLLMHHLLEAIHLNAVVVLVGDVFQLPPVGPGNVLADFIEAGHIATFELTRIFRQETQSPIITNAHLIRQGRPPHLTPPDDTDLVHDFYFIQTNNPTTAVATIAELCQRRIPDRFKVDPIEDIQVLTPMHKGDVGTINLNRVLQRTLNPGAGRSIDTVGPFRMGDKVMHLKNNYPKEVFNGDIGRVIATDKKYSEVVVDYDGRQVKYDNTELDELALAYAISVHKSQGSEYPVVILPLFTQHYPLLQRNLLYTAITRGKQLVIIIGVPRAVEIALANDKPQQRLSGLFSRLKDFE